MARLKARRSRYRLGNRITSGAPAAIIATLLLVTVGVASLAAGRVIGFLNTVTGGGVSAHTFGRIIGAADPEPDPLSLAYKLKHKQRINLLFLGYGGAENDAPYLTDSMMVITIDPASGRVTETSVPRDLWVKLPVNPALGTTWSTKINAAYTIGAQPGTVLNPAANFTGRDGGGHASEAAVSKVTGLTFDRYFGVDFKGFRDVVDALGGISVHMDGPLDDCHYPDYHDGYMNHGVPVGFACPPAAGIHFKGGDYTVSGEQALQISRSRDAVQAAQSSDFGRARRQQMIISAIRKQASGFSVLTRGPQLMSALEKNFRTDVSFDDLVALYQWGKGIDEKNILHFALTNSNLLTDEDQCGQPVGSYALCAEDPSFKMIKSYIASELAPPAVLTAKAPVQVVWSGNSGFDPTPLSDRLTDALKPFNLALTEPVRATGRVDRTVIYDYSNGQYPETAQFLSQFLGGADVVVATPSTPAPIKVRTQSTSGFVIFLGHDYGIRWYNLAS